MRKHATRSTVLQDVLREDANADSTSLQAKWAREALLHVQARRASNTLCSLVYRSGLSHEAYLDEGAMLLVSLFLQSIAEVLGRKHGISSLFVCSTGKVPLPTV